MSPPTRHADDYLLTVQDVAKVLRVSTRTIWRYCKDGRIPAPLRYSRVSVRWRASDIQKHLANLNGNGTTH